MAVDGTTTVWHMNPSVAGNVIFGVLFLGFTAGHVYLRWESGPLSKFMNPLIAGGVFEILGYLIRAGATSNLESIGPYAIQSLFLLLAPILFAATCYMTLSRMIAAAKAEHLSPIPLRWLTRIFVSGDILCFLIQGGGGRMQSAGNSLYTTGKWIVVVGLVLQIAIFSCYVFTTYRFQTRIRQTPTAESLDPAHPWRKIITIIYVASVLITLRNVVRIAEYAQGFDGWIITHEFMLFIFDGALMSILMVLLLVWHPGKLLVAYHQLTPASVQMTFGKTSDEELMRRT